MGEIAEMMINGTLCEGCGDYMGPATGFPRRCESCEPSKKRKFKKRKSKQRPGANPGNKSPG